ISFTRCEKGVNRCERKGNRFGSAPVLVDQAAAIPRKSGALAPRKVSKKTGLQPCGLVAGGVVAGVVPGAVVPAGFFATGFFFTTGFFSGSLSSTTVFFGGAAGTAACAVFRSARSRTISCSFDAARPSM